MHTPIRLKELTHRHFKRVVKDEAGEVTGEEIVEKPITDGLTHTFELVNSKDEVVFESAKRFPTPEAALRCATRTLKTVSVI